MKLTRVSVIGITLFLLAALTTSVLAAAGDTTRVSVTSSGAQVSMGGTYPAISGDGRYVAFKSAATDLVSGDTNGYIDIFVRDLQTGSVILVSVAPDGTQANDNSGDPCISNDGRYVAFWSNATNLVGTDANARQDVFLHDRDTDANGTYDEAGFISTELVSVATGGAQGNGNSYYPSISGDGSRVAFQSLSNNLSTAVSNADLDVFLRDRDAGTTTLVSIDKTGVREGSYASYAPAISADGNFVTFASGATDLVNGDTGGRDDIFLRNLGMASTTLLSRTSGGVQGNDNSYTPCISSDGRYVAFDSAATNLVGSDTNSVLDVFLRDTLTSTTTRVSVSSGGTQGNLQSEYCSISGDGRYIAFESYANTLITGDSNSDFDVFIHDQQTGETVRVSISSAGTQGDDVSGDPSISSDGSIVSFHSDATNLVSGDTNGVRDVFVHENDLPTICPQVTEIPGTECDALAVLYDSTEGDDWTDHTDWLVTDTPCSWYGITCDSGHVTGVNLENNNLSGSIPSTLKDLTQLEGLYLAANHLTGNIPPALGNLSELQYLYLDTNSLSGSIPSELGNLSQLRILVLGGNPLTGTIPSSLGSLTQLQELFLSNAEIGGTIPSSLGNLSQLTYLGLDGNQLTGTIPSTFGNLDLLLTLQLSNNQLTSAIPPELGGMASLQELYLDNNGFWGSIPPELGSLTTLTSLSLEVNQLRGQFPTSITSLVNLTTLSFDCQLTSSDAGVIAFIEVLVPNWQDSTCPTVVSSTRADPDPTNWGNVNFTVTFSEPVSGVGVEDFDLTETGTLNGSAVMEVLGGSTVYNVSVSTGTGDGYLRLDVIHSPSIQNIAHSIAFQGSYTDGENYTIDKTAPTVLSSTRVHPITTAKASVQFTVTFSEDVTDVGQDDFNLTKTGGITGESVTGVTGSGTTYTVTVNTGSGDGTLRLDVITSGLIQDRAANAMVSSYVSGEVYTVSKTFTAYSAAASDGYVLESTETSNAGGTINSALTTFRLGDDPAKKQYRSILSFITSGLPDNATLTSVTLKIKQQSATGGTTFSMFQGLLVDIRKGTFGTLALAATDFQAAASKVGTVPFTNAAVGGWYSFNLTSSKTFINLLATNSGATQFRLRFKLDDNNNAIANYISFYSGNSATNKPTLVITYYVP